jgi:CheY-like chemotaxis protein
MAYISVTARNRCRGDQMSSTVLYIEDDASNIRLVERLLMRRPSIELRVATSGRAGIQAAIDHQPALILLDNRLPDATGAEVLRQLSAGQATARIPVVVLSGDSGAAARELLEVGAAEFLAKPFDVHQFMTMIDRYLP